MSFFRFAFSFLYTRNWHTGEMEISRPRLALFCGAIFLLMLALTIISFLQAPVVYTAK
ncbi:hypothetical protein KC865_01730 [Candidatus Kaiserbacteria bacterium]|nr:hypothetical protein [Candidatus Kaiserbacteria bacterium]USN91993.1 MAG: hypothetical protein H6782_03905 [Candidatus Nomurabacteria bacterium]